MSTDVTAASRQLADFVRRSPDCREAPREWMVEATNRCNLTCAMCPRHTVRFDVADMPLDFFESLMLRHPGLEAVWPYGFGEPLLHPRIADLIRCAKGHGKTVSLSTNATLLDAARGALLLESGLDYLILAVDGIDDVYGRNRYPADLREVEGRIGDFLALKLAWNSDLHVTVQLVRMQNNSHQVRGFRKRWTRRGVDVVRVRDDLSGFSGTAIRRPSMPPARKRPCFFLWRGPLFVQAVGTVIPCPYYHGSFAFGDLRCQSALEAWNSPAMRMLRAAHLAGTLSDYPVCARCPRHQPPRALAALSFFVTTDLIRRIFPKLEDLQRRLHLKFFE